MEGAESAREQEAAARKHNQVLSLAQVTTMRLRTLDPQLEHFIYSQEPLLEVLAGARTGTVLSVEKDALLADFLVFQDALSTLGGKRLEWVPRAGKQERTKSNSGWLWRASGSSKTFNTRTKTCSAFGRIALPAT